MVPLTFSDMKPIYSKDYFSSASQPAGKTLRCVNDCSEQVMLFFFPCDF